MVQVQRARLANSDQLIWLVIGDDFLPIEPIQSYLRYLGSLERSPNTIQAYARHLKLFWEFLQFGHLDWQAIALDNLADFIHWLRCPASNVVPIQPQQAKRTERTINAIMTAVCGFYEFHEHIKPAEGVGFNRYQFQFGHKYKSFLHHINQGKPVRTKLLKIKEPKQFSGCLSIEEVKRLVDACHRIRDKFLICLLYESGLRIGEALGLRHEDVRSTGENEIHVVPRSDNNNRMRTKSLVKRVVHVTRELMSLYADYLIEEYPEDIDSDYVFVNIWKGQCGAAMRYAAVDSLFKRIRKKTGLTVYPHLLRHTHATELIRTGWDMSYVQKRLGHSNIQTTINTYIHLRDEDLKAEYKKFLEMRKLYNASKKSFSSFQSHPCNGIRI